MVLARVPSAVRWLRPGARGLMLPPMLRGARRVAAKQQCAQCSHARVSRYAPDSLLGNAGQRRGLFTFVRSSDSDSTCTAAWRQESKEKEQACAAGGRLLPGQHPGLDRVAQVPVLRVLRLQPAAQGRVPRPHAVGLRRRQPAAPLGAGRLHRRAAGRPAGQAAPAGAAARPYPGRALAHASVVKGQAPPRRGNGMARAGAHVRGQTQHGGSCSLCSRMQVMGLFIGVLSIYL